METIKNPLGTADPEQPASKVEKDVPISAEEKIIAAKLQGLSFLNREKKPEEWIPLLDKPEDFEVLSSFDQGELEVSDPKMTDVRERNPFLQSNVHFSSSRRLLLNMTEQKDKQKGLEKTITDSEREFLLAHETLSLGSQETVFAFFYALATNMGNQKEIKELLLSINSKVYQKAKHLAYGESDSRYPNGLTKEKQKEILVDRIRITDQIDSGFQEKMKYPLLPGDIELIKSILSVDMKSLIYYVKKYSDKK